MTKTTMTTTTTLLLLTTVGLLLSTTVPRCESFTPLSTTTKSVHSFAPWSNVPSLHSGTTSKTHSSTLLQQSPLYMSPSDNGSNDMVSSSTTLDSNKNPRVNWTLVWSKTKSWLQTIDRAGLKLKPLAVEAKNKQESERPMQIWRQVQSSLLYTLFIAYRAYRGFFVILPAVFQDVYSKLESTVERNVFDDDDIGIDYSTTSTGVDDYGNGVQAVPRNNNNAVVGTTNKNSKKLRTTITVSIMAAVVTTSYTIGGAIRVVNQLIRSGTKTKSVPTSLEAAANQVMTNEQKILTKFAKGQQQQSTMTNGSTTSSVQENGGNIAANGKGFYP